MARYAALWTGQALTPENAAYFTALSEGPLLVDGFQLTHGSPYDEDEYMMSSEDAALAFEYLETRLAFFGHTHMQGGFIWNHGRVETISPLWHGSGPDVMKVDGDCGYLVNPGSVGQPRDGDPRAACRSTIPQPPRWNTVASTTTSKPRNGAFARRGCRPSSPTACRKAAEKTVGAGHARPG